MSELHEVQQSLIAFLDSVPQYVWEGLLSFANIVAVGLVLGWFAVRYQKRKEIETKIQGDVLRLRLKACERINVKLCELYKQVAPPLYQQQELDRLLCQQEIRHGNIEYASIFYSRERFEQFYGEMQRILIEEHIYLDYVIERKYHSALSYFTKIKCFMDAFYDTEHAVRWALPASERNECIDLGYRLMGVSVQNDIAMIYGVLDKEIARLVRNINLSFNDDKWNKWWNRLLEHRLKGKSIFTEDGQMGVSGLDALLVKWTLKNSLLSKTSFFRDADKFVFLYAGLHFRNDEEYLRLPQSRQMAMLKEYTDFFFNMFYRIKTL